MKLRQQVLVAMWEVLLVTRQVRSFLPIGILILRALLHMLLEMAQIPTQHRSQMLREAEIIFLIQPMDRCQAGPLIQLNG